MYCKIPDTKALMEKRDKTRNAISKAGKNEKQILITKYKKLRNQVNSKIRAESVAFNEKRVNDANDENEIWNIVNDVIDVINYYYYCFPQIRSFDGFQTSANYSTPFRFQTKKSRLVDICLEIQGRILDKY